MRYQPGSTHITVIRACFQIHDLCKRLIVSMFYFSLLSVIEVAGHYVNGHELRQDRGNKPRPARCLTYAKKWSKHQSPFWVAGGRTTHACVLSPKSYSCRQLSKFLLR